jgi:hypothetical protein
MNNYDKNSRDKLVSILIIAVSLVILVVLIFYFVVIYDDGSTDKTQAMPNIVGYSVADVQGCYSRFFSVEVEGEEYSEFGEGVILSQSIAPNEEYSPGNTVVGVTISAGEEPVTEAVTEVSEEEETEEVTEITEEEEEEVSDKETGLFVDSPSYKFETDTGGAASTLITTGIDESDPDIASALEALYNVLIKKYGDAGFIYVDLESGAYAEYNADEKFSAASIIKAPYARAVLGSENDLDESFEMTEDMLNSSSELINDQPVGTMFTISELVCAAIERSDNTAYKMLYNYIGYDCFNELAEGIGMTQRMTDDNYWFKLSARETAAYFKDIYFFNELHENGSLMKEYLSNAERNNLYADALDEYTVCEKYGYLPQEDFYTLGDAAIVYADSPYIIAGYIRSTSTELNTKIFRDTAVCADNLHKLLHPDT